MISTTIGAIITFIFFIAGFIAGIDICRRTMQTKINILNEQIKADNDRFELSEDDWMDREHKADMKMEIIKKANGFYLHWITPDILCNDGKMRSRYQLEGLEQKEKYKGKREPYKGATRK